ncbi:MAG: DNA-binding protein [Acidimicrobiales bacterium]|nr:DNA-binding protein [Acidimicrobiales bacterium]
MNEAPAPETSARPTAHHQPVAKSRSSDLSAEESTIASAPFNSHMEAQFRLAAELLEAQGAGGYRIRSYRRAADALHFMTEPLCDIYRKSGIPGLIAIPTIGESLAQAIADTVDFGSWRWLDRLRGDVAPERVLCTVAGIGPGLAAKIHDRLGIESLEDLELAAHDGRLAIIDGFGPKRVQSVIDSLAGRLGRIHPLEPTDPEWVEPAVRNLPLRDELLDVDREYRERAARGELTTIAPRRFNPQHERWLPILHTVRGGRHYTAMYSNTARAHQLGRTNDWVVIYNDEPNGGQWTAVTATTGPNRGERVIRGPVAQPT